MADNPREFEAGPDPFGRRWSVRFEWLQNAISIRHADMVDVKFRLSTAGEPEQEKVIALSHPHLFAAAEKVGGAVSDAWCMRLAGLHLRRMVESFEDMEKTLVTVSGAHIEEYARELAPAGAGAAGR